MANFITEDMIEQAILKKLGEPAFGYDIVVCDASPDKKEDLNDGTGRSAKTECILPRVLEESLCRINPEIPAEKLTSVIKDLTADFSDSDLVSKNYELYSKIRNYIKIPLLKNGKEDYLKPWKFTSDDRRFELDFIPVIDRASCTDFKVLKSDQHQVFGNFSGTVVLDDGSPIQIRNLFGFAEKVENKW